jgi:hypothetical protein
MPPLEQNRPARRGSAWPSSFEPCDPPRYGRDTSTMDFQQGHAVARRHQSMTRL